MPRALPDLIDHQDELAEAFEPGPDGRLDARPLESLRHAMNQRGDA